MVHATKQGLVTKRSMCLGGGGGVGAVGGRRRKREKERGKKHLEYMGNLYKPHKSTSKSQGFPLT